MSPQPIFQFFKPRNTLILVGTCALFVGVYTRNSHLLAVAIGCLAALVYAFVQSNKLLGKVGVRRTHLPRAFQQSSVMVNLQISCGDEKSPELVLVEDYFPPGGAHRVRRLIEYPLRRGEFMEIGYVGRCEHRRGPYVLGPVRLQASDGLGFFQREVILEEFTQLLVYPLAVELRNTDLLGEGTLAHVGLDMSRRAGVSEEFLGVREYRAGDSPRLIHWKTSARHGKFMVKEFQEELTTLVSLFLDLGRLGLVGVGDQTSVEYGIKSCASLARRTIERGHRLQFFGVGKSVEHIPPGGGTAHLQTVLDRLAYLKPEGESGFAAVMGDLARHLPRGSTAVAIMGATTINLNAVQPLVSLLLDRHILPVFVVIDDRAFIKIYREQEMSHVKALPLEDIVKHLRLLGVRVHIIRRARSMEQALVQGLEEVAAL